MEFKVNIVMEEKTRECIERLTGVLEKGIKLDSNVISNVNVPQVKEKPMTQVAPTPTSNTEDRATGDVKEETPQTTPTPNVDPAPEVPKATLPTYTDEQLRTVCAEASKLGIGPKVKDLINNTFGVKSVYEIPNDKREEFVNKLRELGVRA